MAVMNDNEIFYILESKQTDEPLMLSVDKEQFNVRINQVICHKVACWWFDLELSQEERDAIEEMDHDADTAPPGEEGFDISHEGGKHEVFEDVAASLAEAAGW